MYHLRARYLNPETGRFWTLDTYEGTSDPASLHKYLYCGAEPVNQCDPSGRSPLTELVNDMAIRTHIFATMNIGKISLGLFVVTTFTPLGEGLEAIPPGTPGPLDEIGQGRRAIRRLKQPINEYLYRSWLSIKAFVGSASTRNYRTTFFNAFDALRGKVFVHHAIEQQVLKDYPGLFTESEIHSLQI